MSKLFEQLKFKDLELKNRIVVPPMVCFDYAKADGYVSQKNITHYQNIAKGEPGLIIQEAACVSKSGRLATCQLGIWEDGHIEGLKQIVDAVHAEQVPILIQIHHAGIMGISEYLDCPSDYELEGGDKGVTVGHEMTLERIAKIKQDFIDAGIRAYKAGYDGIELHGCHNYLLCQFMNKKVNKRTDVYGLKPELLTLEILDGIRKATSDSFIIGIRLGGFEPTLEDGIAHAKVLEEGGIDFINVSYGFSAESPAEKPDDFPFQDIIYAAKEIKANVSIPVFAVYGIINAQLADDILVQTQVDMVNIGRGILVNPNWAKDAYIGADTGKCLYCKTCIWSADALKCPGHLLYMKNRQELRG